MKMKCYIDVNFTIEEDLYDYPNEDKEKFLNNKDKIVELFKQDLLEQLDYSATIKDLDVVVKYEETELEDDKEDKE